MGAGVGRASRVRVYRCVAPGFRSCISAASRRSTGVPAVILAVDGFAPEIIIMNVDRFARLPLLGIVRGIESHRIEELIDTVIASGLEALEITMNTPGAPELIARAVEHADGKLMLGAGTVLSRSEFDAAIAAGASYIVMPALVDEVAAACREQDIPFFPGALTPQEIFNAWRAGATMVKVFPAGFFGPDYFREIKGPFADIRLLACGGISADSIAAYANAGAEAFAFGGSIFNPTWIQESRYDLIQSALTKLIEAYHLSQ